MQACTVNIVPLTLVAKIASQSSSLMSTSFVSGKTPALAQSTSMPPKASSASAAIRLQSSTFATSAITVATSQASCSRASSSAAAASVASSRAAISTLHPARAKTRAMPLPIPLLPPVTTTERPCSDVNIRPPPVSTPVPDVVSAVRRQVALGELTAGRGELLPHVLGQVGAGVRPDPGDEQQAPHHHERGDLGLVLGGQLAHRPVATDPGLGQLGHPRVVLEEADRGAE